ncbi:MAG TPA: hypothetical protein VMO17_02840 [Terriglobia bacterium]|nr:hypothetical protein [Terriglobia bacterium]
MLTTALTLLAPVLGTAQNAENSYGAQGYFFLAPIVSNTTNVLNPAYNGVVFVPGEPLPPDLFLQGRGGTNIGFGGEAFVYKGLGVGAEAGYAAPTWRFDAGETVGVGSVDASYHFFDQAHRRRLEPFIAGGYSLYFGDRTDFQNGYNFGGGLNLWIAKHAALRLEVRDQGNIHYFHSQFTNFVAFRVGMTFR